MRYIALITLVYLLILLVADELTGGGVGGLLGALFVLVFAVPFAIIAGIPLLWLARKIRPGSGAVLVPLGTVAGAITPIIISTLLGLPLALAASLIGAALGLLSAGLWWLLVERWPELRAYYD